MMYLTDPFEYLDLETPRSPRRLNENPVSALAAGDAAFALEPGGRCRARVVPVGWLDPDRLQYLRHCQAAWDKATPEQRQAARTRLAAVGRSMGLANAGRAVLEADAAAGHEFGLSASTVGKWRRRYWGATPIERLLRLLDDAARRT